MGDLSGFDLMREDPLKPVLDAGIFVEPKDRGDTREFTRQMALVNFLRRHAPRLIVFAIPNATRGDWSKIRQQREGAVYGAPDLALTWAGGCAWIEMKDGTGKPQDRQIDFLNRLHGQRHHVAVCRSVDGAVQWLRSIGAPVPEMQIGRRL